MNVKMLRGLHTIKTAKNPSKSLWWLNKKWMKHHHTWISSTNCHTTTGLQETLCQVNRMITLYLGCWWFAEIKLVWQLTVCGKSFGHFFVSQLGKCQHWLMPLIICAKPSQHVGTFTHGENSMIMRRVKSTQLQCLREETC